MAFIYKHASIIKELIKSNQLTVKNNEIIYNGELCKIEKSLAVLILLESGKKIYPNCYMIAYFYQSQENIPNGYKIVPKQDKILDLSNLEIVPVNTYKGPPSNKNTTKMSIENIVNIRKEYRERMIVPCSFSMLRKKYGICNTQIVHILYNPSQEEFWAKAAAIEPPLIRDTTKHIKVKHRSLSEETRKKLSDAMKKVHLNKPKIIKPEIPKPIKEPKPRIKQTKQRNNIEIEKPIKQTFKETENHHKTVFPSFKHVEKSKKKRSTYEIFKEILQEELENL